MAPITEPGSPLVARLQSQAPFLLGLLLVYVFVKGLAQSALTPISGDETFTLELARETRASVLWHALLRGADGQPPLFYLIERFFLHVTSNAQIALRLPSLLAFCCTATCLYLFVRKRAGSFQALLCAVLLLNTTLYLIFAIQARPYSLVAAGVAFAMVCYQRAPNPFWTCLLFVSLALAVSLHYYAIFAVGAFIAAEAAFYFTARKIRAGVWLAILGGGMPLLVFWPLLQAQKQMFAQHFWAQPTLSGALIAYSSFLLLPSFLGLALAVVIGLGLLKAEIVSLFSKKDAVPREDVRIQEVVLLLAILAMPFALSLAARIAHGGFVERYVIWVTVGVAAGVGYLLPRFSKSGLAALAAFLFVATAAQEVRALHSLKLRAASTAESPDAPVRRLLRSAGHEDLPVVLWGGYTDICYYAAPDVAKRLVTITDPASAVDYMGTDTVEKLAAAMASYSVCRAVDFGSFAPTERVFLLYTSDFSAPQATTVFYDWWVPKLVKDGYFLQLLAAEGNARIYLVRAPEARSHPDKP